jgi:hypothetical protein
MPRRRARPLGERLKFLSAIVGPRLSALRAFCKKRPEPATLVRIWVGLGAAHCAAMTFWPYPKTYLLGLVLYILSLGLVLVTGIWGARLSWDERLGAAHTVCLPGETQWRYFNNIFTHIALILASLKRLVSKNSLGLFSKHLFYH